MAKHRRFSDKPKDKPSSHQTPDILESDPNAETVQDFSATSQKTSKDFKSIILSGTKYAYIIGAVALLSGIFTPLTIGAEIEAVIVGMLSIFLGLTGGIIIFLGIKTQKYTTIMVCGGLAMMIGSLILIYQSTNHPLIN
jgi:hypothetical protein